MTEEELARFWVKVRVHTGGCWEWTACPDSRGYGRFSFSLGQGRQRWKLAHRLAYEIYNGELPSALCVCHHCDNRLCVRREHLFLGTHKDNTEDRDRKGRRTALKGEVHGAARLTDENVLAIRADSRSYKTRAAHYGVCVATISHIVNRRTWKHI
jgi:hypothetical protein